MGADEGTAGSAGADDAAADDTSNAGEGDAAAAGEGTTPEEVQQVMRNAGVKLPAEKAAAADDSEEGDDPDAGAADEGAGDAGAADEGSDEGDDAAAADDDLADDGKPTPTAEEVKAAQDARNAEISDKYSFEVTDANGVTFKIPVGATMEEVLAEFEPKNNGQVIDILKKLGELEALKATDDAKEADETSKTEQAQRASEIRQGWATEEKDLQAQKRIPEGKDGEKRVADIYKFMAEENDARMKAGKPTLNSFEDALDKLENKEARNAKVAADKKEKDDARKNGALVGGSSAAVTTATPVYRAGSAKNANAALRSMGMLE